MSGNSTPTKLDSNAIFQRAFEEDKDRLRVDAAFTMGENEVVISHLDDSIRLGDGVNLITASQNDGKTGLDVNLIAGEVNTSGLSKALKPTAKTITDVATKVPTVPLDDRNGISVRVWGDATVYFGDGTVTAANGYPKRKYEEIMIDIKDNPSVELYAICASGESSEIRILEVA